MYQPRPIALWHSPPHQVHTHSDGASTCLYSIHTLLILCLTYVHKLCVCALSTRRRQQHAMHACALIRCARRPLVRRLLPIQTSGRARRSRTISLAAPHICISNVRNVFINNISKRARIESSARLFAQQMCARVRVFVFVLTRAWRAHLITVNGAASLACDQPRVRSHAACSCGACVRRPPLPIGCVQRQRGRGQSQFCQ